MAKVGGPMQNGHAERRMRTITKEEVDLSDDDDYHEKYEQIGRLLEAIHMPKRIRSGLGYLTPAKFESRWLRASVESKKLLTESCFCA